MYTENGKQFNYEYLLVDSSMILMSSFFVATKYNQSTFSMQGLVKMFIQSVAKIVREQGPFEKVILLHDRWPYHKTSFLPDYKGDRHYASDESVANIGTIIDMLKTQLAILESNITPTQEQLAELEQVKVGIIDHEAWKASEELNKKNNKIKNDAKYFIIRHFEQYGIPSFLKQGFEADDLAKIFTENYKPTNGKKSLLGTSDGDWFYLMNDHIDMFHLKRKVIYTVTDLRNEIEGFPGEPYLYKSLWDSLFGSHNNMQPTANDECINGPSWKQVVIDAHASTPDTYLRPDYQYTNEAGDCFLIKPKELFEANMRSWDIHLFPEFDKAKGMMYYVKDKGRVSDMMEFNMFALAHGLAISNDYYMELANSLNHDKYLSPRKEVVADVSHIGVSDEVMKQMVEAQNNLGNGTSQQAAEQISSTIDTWIKTDISNAVPLNGQINPFANAVIPIENGIS